MKTLKPNSEGAKARRGLLLLFASLLCVFAVNFAALAQQPSVFQPVKHVGGGLNVTNVTAFSSDFTNSGGTITLVNPPPLGAVGTNDFNTSQFAWTGTRRVSIKTGASVTNLQLYGFYNTAGYVPVSSGTNFTDSALRMIAGVPFITNGVGGAVQDMLHFKNVNGEAIVGVTSGGAGSLTGSGGLALGGIGGSITMNGGGGTSLQLLLGNLTPNQSNTFTVAGPALPLAKVTSVEYDLIGSDATTNRYTDDGTNFLRNGVPIAGGGGPWTDDGTFTTLTDYPDRVTFRDSNGALYLGTGPDANTNQTTVNIGDFSGLDQDLSESTGVHNIGRLTGVQQTVRRSQDITSIGIGAGFDRNIINSTNIVAIGGDSGELSFHTNVNDALFLEGGGDTAFIFDSSRVTAIGRESLGDSVIHNSFNLDFANSFAGAHVDLDGVGNMDVQGFQAAQYFTGRDSTDLLFQGTEAGDHAIADNSVGISYRGVRAGYTSALTNSYYVIFDGAYAGVGLEGTYTNIHLIGAGAVPTKTNDQVALGPGMDLLVPGSVTAQGTGFYAGTNTFIPNAADVLVSYDANPKRINVGTDDGANSAMFRLETALTNFTMYVQATPDGGNSSGFSVQGDAANNSATVLFYENGTNKFIINHGGTISLSGETNRVGMNGIGQLTVDGVPVGGGAWDHTGTTLTLTDNSGPAALIQPDLFLFSDHGDGNFPLIQSGDLIVGIGSYPFVSSVFTNALAITGIGINPIAGASVTNVNNFIAIGQAALNNAMIHDSSDLVAIGDAVFSNTPVENSSEIFAFGHSTLSSSYLSNVTHVISMGASSMQGATLNDSSHILALGYATGNGLYGSFNNIVMLGDSASILTSFPATIQNSVALGANAHITSSGQMVLGPSGGITNYVFNGFTTYVDGSGNWTLPAALSTSDPGSGAGAWKLGTVQTGLTLTLNTTNAPIIDIGGTKYYVMIANETPP